VKRLKDALAVALAWIGLGALTLLTLDAMLVLSYHH
jgi:hypothetical protein